VDISAGARSREWLGWALAAGIAVCASLSAAADTPASYEVLGKRYRVLDSSKGYVERGVASWYGHAFHGNKTASGERFDMYAMTAAHPTLPIPTDAQVTNLLTGKTVVVRINDRGPFVGRRIIDLSYAAGQALGFVGSGTALVEVRSLGPPRTSRRGRESTLEPEFIQVGAYSRSANAKRMRARLEAAGLAPVIVHDVVVGARHLHSVRVGPMDRPARERAIERMHDLGIADVRVVHDDQPSTR
jgi:rare lipoprotein A